MASSNSAKKVARVAARSGSGAGANAGKAAKQRNWLFAAAILVIVAMGVGVVAFARDRNEGLGKNDVKPRARIGDSVAFDHWHASFAFSVCGKELPVVQEAPGDPLGIHTHGDGLIHIHPFSVRAAGKRATLSRFFDQTGIKVNDEGFQTQTDEVYNEAETKCGSEATEVVLAHWKDAATAAGRKPDEVYTEDFGSIRFTEDLGAYTLAIVPKGQTDDIPAPSISSEIVERGAEDSDAAPQEVPEETTTVPAEDPGATTTAPSEDESTTTAAPAEDETTTTAAAE